MRTKQVNNLGERGRASRGDNRFDFLLEGRFEVGASFGGHVEGGGDMDKVLIGKVFRFVNSQIKVNPSKEFDFEGIKFMD